MTDATEAKARVAGFATEDEARVAATRLLEHGVGALLVFSSAESSVAQWWVTVLPEDYRRACDVLGVEPVELEPEATGPERPRDDAWPIQPKRWPPDRDHLRRFVAVYVVLLVVVTGLVFVGTYWLTGGFDDAERAPVPGTEDLRTD